MTRCKCSCLNHTCNCAIEDCPNCPCGPSRGITLGGARIDHCNIHSINFAYGQNCPECAKGR